MLKETQKEVVLATEVVSLEPEKLEVCKNISIELATSHTQVLSAGNRMNTATALMLKLMGLKPDYYLLKQVQQVILNTLVNEHKLALSTSEKLFSQMLKQLQFANAKFIKPSKPSKDAQRISVKRKALKEKYIHEALESVEAKLAKVNRIIGQAYLDDDKPKDEDIKLQKELNDVKKIKSEKLVSQQKEQQGKNIKAMVEKVQNLLKIDSGRVNKKNEPVLEWSIVELDFAYRCLQHKTEVKKFLSSLK